MGRFMLFVLICALVAKALGGIALTPFVIIAFCILFGIWGYVGTTRAK